MTLGKSPVKKQRRLEIGISWTRRAEFLFGIGL